MRKIEIEFPVDIELPDGFDQLLSTMVNVMICKPYERANPTRVMWPAGHGFKPVWSVADAAFLGRKPDLGAPANGEPTFDENVYSIEVSERECSEKELKRRQGK